jgi:chaperone required for assembly of F1-ATPase
MSDGFEGIPGSDPLAAARRGARPARRRFFRNAAAAAVESGHAVRLDDKLVHTPARRILAAPTPALAQAIAAEWDAQAEVIAPAKMPLTRLASAIIDGVAESRAAVAAEVARYLACDLVFYRAVTPSELAARQVRHWDPILGWAEHEFGARFLRAEGIMHIAQPAEALAAAGAAIPDDPWRLGAVHAATTLTGSALIALALTRGFLSADAAWQAANVDEDWNVEQWGRDELAFERRAYRFAELKAAAMVLACLRE